MRMRFRNREEAGRMLAKRLRETLDETPVVLALPRGGVPVGYEVATALGVPLEVLVARKLGVPWRPELGMGALAEGGALYVNPEVLAYADLTNEDALGVANQEARELARRVRLYRSERPLPDMRGRTVLLVDDGLATGGTARAAARAVRALGPDKLVLAVPVASAETAEALRREEVDEVIAVQEPDRLGAVSAWYEDFHQVDDEEVLTLLTQAHNLGASP
ncbi:phosphoribosyltransferase [Archangium lansingense]|uniref:Phosphoribosyltransferase family protein n=1 Tax=Archangium lansingense TaxID=2995310 RepID=A0ABT4AM91_9BACT|nr:phosphoribosyltransferase family protein [Archangium lansinium]MCY1082817.1 phosphoribosyltransferase family protein [Archangium lansinium]